MTAQSPECFHRIGEIMVRDDGKVICLMVNGIEVVVPDEVVSTTLKIHRDNGIQFSWRGKTHQMPLPSERLISWRHQLEEFVFDLAANGPQKACTQLRLDAIRRGVEDLARNMDELVLFCTDEMYLGMRIGVNQDDSTLYAKLWTSVELRAHFGEELTVIEEMIDKHGLTPRAYIANRGMYSFLWKGSIYEVDYRCQGVRYIQIPKGDTIQVGIWTREAPTEMRKINFAPAGELTQAIFIKKIPD
jgi:hypothetical protein